MGMPIWTPPTRNDNRKINTLPQEQTPSITQAWEEQTRANMPVLQQDIPLTRKITNAHRTRAAEGTSKCRNTPKHTNGRRAGGKWIKMLHMAKEKMPEFRLHPEKFIYEYQSITRRAPKDRLQQPEILRMTETATNRTEHPEHLTLPKSQARWNSQTRIMAHQPEQEREQKPTKQMNRNKNSRKQENISPGEQSRKWNTPKYRKWEKEGPRGKPTKTPKKAPGQKPRDASHQSASNIIKDTSREQNTLRRHLRGREEETMRREMPTSIRSKCTIVITPPMEQENTHQDRDPQNKWKEKHRAQTKKTRPPGTKTILEEIAKRAQEQEHQKKKRPKIYRIEQRKYRQRNSRRKQNRDT